MLLPTEPVWLAACCLEWLDLRLLPLLKADGATTKILRGLDQELFVVLDSFPREVVREFFELAGNR